MGRTQRSPPGQHRHCEKCFSKRCQAPVDPGTSCVMISCRSHCGATFHLCKEEEHRLLCPHEWVPCLNSVFGCPFSMSRFKLAKHLKVCPASVVFCSMDWNRWPNIDRKTTLHENIMKEEHREDCLDVALALRDQVILFDTLNMAELFPELAHNAPQEGLCTEESGAMGGADSEHFTSASGSMGMNNGEVAVLSQFERDALAKGKDGMDLTKFSEWDSIFSKEKSAARYLESNIGKNDSKIPHTSQGLDTKAAVANDDEELQKAQGEDKRGEQVDKFEKGGFAPWQEGVLERLKSEVDIGDYNMYLVHHGSMLIRFGQMAACTPKDKDFVYGNLEAQEVKTVCTFKVPTSYCGRRAKIGDESRKIKKEHKSVDTSDLGVNLEDLPISDTINITLLCSLENELKGHVISETKALDGLFIDLGTQTYDFGLDAFSKKTVLADVLPGRTLGLHVGLQSECVTRRHNKSNSSFTFSCNHVFRRDEFSSHFKNVHSDIQSCLNGWFQQRCPLSYLGCTFVQNQFCPVGPKSQIIYSKQLQTFAIKPQVASTLYEGVRPNLSRNHRGKSKDSLSSLPLEIVQHIAGFLDSFSLSQLSQVSVLMRDVCATLLQERGMVHLHWEKKTYSHGGTSWRCRKKLIQQKPQHKTFVPATYPQRHKRFFYPHLAYLVGRSQINPLRQLQDYLPPRTVSQVWQFSSLFSTVHQWRFDDVPSMSQHLKVCPFNSVEYKKEPFALPSLDGPEQQAKGSLVSFKHRL